MTSFAPSLPAIRPEPRYKVARWAGANPIFGPLREIQAE